MERKTKLERKTKRGIQTAAPPLSVSSDWGGGPRTPEWDRLWRTILGGLDPERPTYSGQQLGREGDDG